MKQLFACLLLMLAFSMASFSQNGGSSNESDALRIDWLGAGKLSVLNKQSGTATIQVDFGTSTTSVVLDAGLSTIVTAPLNAQISAIRAKPLTNAGGFSMGYVTLPLSVLPITFKSVTSKWLNKHTLMVYFDVADVSGVNYYKVRVSRDGETWQDKTIVFPESTQANTLYSVKLNF